MTSTARTEVRGSYELRHSAVYERRGPPRAPPPRGRHTGPLTAPTNPSNPKK